MAAPDWTFWFNYDGSDRDITGSGRNVTGSPLVSASKIESYDEGAATAPAGVWQFTMETTTTVSVTYTDSQDTGSPVIYTGTKTVVSDGVTENLNLVPGWAIVLANDLSADDVFEVGIGCYYDSSVGSWIRALSLGTGKAGFASAARSIIVQNDAGAAQQNCKIVATNKAWIENGQTGSRPFYCQRQTGLLNPTKDSDLDGTAITFTNFAAGTPNTVDILVGGSPIDVYDVDGDVLIPDGEDLECDDAHIYRFADGTALQSLEFVLSSSLTGSDTATVFVSDGSESIQLSLVGGSYVSGPTGLDLTSDGNDTGDVDEDDTITVLVRKNIAAAEDTTMNQRTFSLRCYGEAV